jgi:hypothetical protein
MDYKVQPFLDFSTQGSWRKDFAILFAYDPPESVLLPQSIMFSYSERSGKSVDLLSSMLELVSFLASSPKSSIDVKLGGGPKKLDNVLSSESIPK